jgi:hypothetical protein
MFGDTQTPSKQPYEQNGRKVSIKKKREKEKESHGKMKKKAKKRLKRNGSIEGRSSRAGKLCWLSWQGQE